MAIAASAACTATHFAAASAPSMLRIQRSRRGHQSLRWSQIWYGYPCAHFSLNITLPRVFKQPPVSSRKITYVDVRHLYRPGEKVNSRKFPQDLYDAPAQGKQKCEPSLGPAMRRRLGRMATLQITICLKARLHFYMGIFERVS